VIGTYFGLELGEALFIMVSVLGILGVQYGGVE